MPTLLTSRVLRPAAVALGATLLTATAAVASPPNWTPRPGDDRASAHAGNVTTCAAAGLTGTTVTWPNLEDPTSKYVTITSSDVPAGDTIVAVVVKGGPGYNVYQGLASWNDLHSPINVGGQIPTISHWFACVTTEDQSGGGTTTTTTTTTGSTGDTSTSTPASGAAGGSTPTTSGAAAAGATNTASTSTLPYTGFGDSWLIWVGALLLLVGGGVVALPRLARRRS